MTYKKNFVAAIKVGGKILRESKDAVELPFGSEYSVLLKNLDSVRMQARISIDGTDATGWLVIGSGQSVDIERFIENLDRGNRFKFIERTEAVENHRGIKIEDGLVRVEFKREKVYEMPKVVEHHTYCHYYPGGCYPSNPIYYKSLYNQNVTYTSTAGSLNVQAMNCSLEAPVNDAGITVPGSVSNQKFVTVSGFETESSEVIVLRLVGSKKGAPVKIAKTAQDKIECSICGQKNKSSFKFCKECGTSLERV